MEPQVRKAYLVGGVLGFAAGVTVLAISILLFPGLILDLIGPQDEEERPPVVVSNGSVRIGVPDRYPGTPVQILKKGMFRPVGSGARHYRHTGDNEGKDMTITSFVINVVGSAGCSGDSPALTAATINTTQGEIKMSVRPRGGTGSKNDLSFEFGENVVKPANHRLMLGDPHKLLSVTYDTTTCTFSDAVPESQREVRIWPQYQ